MGPMAEKAGSRVPRACAGGWVRPPLDGWEGPKGLQGHGGHEEEKKGRGLGVEGLRSAASKGRVAIGGLPWLAARGSPLAASSWAASPGCVHRSGTRNDTGSCTQGQGGGAETRWKPSLTVQKCATFRDLWAPLPEGRPQYVVDLGAPDHKSDRAFWGLWRARGRGAGGVGEEAVRGRGLGAACAFRRAGVQFRGRVRSGGYRGGR